MKIEVSGSIRKKSTFRMNISWMDAQQRPKTTQIITQRVNRLSAKYESGKIKQNNSWRVLSKENLGEVSTICIWAHWSTICAILLFSCTKPFISLSLLLLVFNTSKYIILWL